MQTRQAQPVTSSVPAISGRTPKRRLEERGPVGPRQEVDDRDLAEELDRRNEERDDDADRGRDRHERAQGEARLDDVLAPAAASGAEPEWLWCCSACRHPAPAP